MARILEGQKRVANMIDDILVFGRTREEHDARLSQVLSRLAKAGLTLNQDKCRFGVSEVSFLGVIVSAQHIKPSPDKVEAIKVMEAPTDIAGVRRLLGMPSGERRPVAFASRSMTETEQRYSQTEKEALATTWAIQQFDEFVRGITFDVETDHLPLVSLFGKMELDMVPPRIQRLRLKTMRYQFRMLHVPGKLLATADTLSRITQKASLPLDTVELFAAQVVSGMSEALPLSPEDVRQAQESNGECRALTFFCHNGWPQKSKLPLHLSQYASAADELSVCHGVLLKGARMVIPHSLRPAVLTLLHEGHQGINRTKALARESIWWPGISADITSLSPWSPRSYLDVPGNLSAWTCSTSLILVVDYHSRYPEVVTLRSTTAQAVIDVLKSIFAWHEIPREVRSYNGPPFSSREFAALAASYGFDHVTSSPHYAQSNEEAERMVRTIKELFRKATDPHLALLSYRDTPGVDGFSPAQLLMRRQLRTKVPKQDSQLCPHWPSRKDVRRTDAAYKQKQAADFNRHHRAQDLSSLRTGQCVWVRPDQVKATVLSPARRPRSYVVETEQVGVLQRNRRHLVPFAPPAPRVEPPPSEEQEPQRTLPPLEPQRITTVQSPDSLGLPSADSDRSHGVTRTRSGRRVVPPNRLNM
nr:uncharacterized protein K02A2.6-like [Rhipicephalus microplus]